MRRYTVILNYPNGSTSHKLNTTSHKHARYHTEMILKDEDLRETASRLIVRQGRNVIFDGAPASIPLEEVTTGIQWPKSGAPTRYMDRKRICISMPGALMDLAKEVGQGNVSLGILSLLLEARPEFADKALERPLAAVQREVRENSARR